MKMNKNENKLKSYNPYITNCNSNLYSGEYQLCCVNFPDRAQSEGCLMNPERRVLLGISTPTEGEAYNQDEY